MKTNKHTSRALMFSVVSLVLCVALLLGTTMAWFTDSVTNTNNTIQAGDLDVEFNYRKLNEAGGYTTVPNNNKDAGDLFTQEAIWEPGHANGVDLQVVNAGDLNLKWQLYFTDITSVDGALEGNDPAADIADVLDVYVIGAEETAAALEELKKVGTLAEIKANGGLVKSGELPAVADGDSNTAFSVVLKMQETAGNTYKGDSVTFAVQLRATQASGEADGFGNPNYDAGATGNPDQDWTGGGTASATIANDQATVLNTSGVKVVLPVGMGTAGGEAKLIAKPIDPPADVPVGYGQQALSYDLSVTASGVDWSANETPVDVEMYIGKGLVNVQLYHDTEPIPSVYDPETGYLFFTTTSFSPYTVVWGEAIPSKMVSTQQELSEAIKSGSGEVIVLKNSIDLTSTLYVRNPVTIDLGGNALTNTKEDGVFSLYPSDWNVCIMNGTIQAGEGGDAISIYHSGETSSVELRNVVVRGGMGTSSYPGTGAGINTNMNSSGKLNLTIQDSSIYGGDSIYEWGYDDGGDGISMRSKEITLNLNNSLVQGGASHDGYRRYSINMNSNGIRRFEVNVKGSTLISDDGIFPMNTYESSRQNVFVSITDSSRIQGEKAFYYEPVWDNLEIRDSILAVDKMWNYYSLSDEKRQIIIDKIGAVPTSQEQPVVVGNPQL